MLLINLFMLFVGMVMDTTPSILILAPLLLPVALEVGVHPVHFGIIIVVNKAIGFVTPPLGVNLFVASSMTDVPVLSLAKKAIPMLCAFLVSLLLITFIPWLSLVLVG